MSYYGNINIPGMHRMGIEDEEETNTYVNSANSRDVRTETKKSDTMRHQTDQHTGSDFVRIRIYRASTVCLGLLCVLLLTAVIVQSVHINTNSTNYTQERNELLSSITNLTEERDKLLTKNMQLTNESNELSSNNSGLIKQRDQLKQEKNELLKMDGWLYSKFSFYFISSEKKSWTDSRRYCTDRGADLIIINNSEEQSFVKKMCCGSKVWIGLTDSDVEGRWKWVDGTSMTSGFWMSGEPNGHGGYEEDCVITDPSVWADHPCNDHFRWICEKNILK